MYRPRFLQYISVTDRQADRRTSRHSICCTYTLHCAELIDLLYSRPTIRAFGPPFVNGFALCYRTVVRSVCQSRSVSQSCLSVCNVGVLCPNGWMIKIKLITEVALGPGHIVFDGDPAPLPKRGTAPPIFGPCQLWPKGWMDQDATWSRGRPGPRRQCQIRFRSSFPLQKGAQ